jgi:hypothetical protein
MRRRRASGFYSKPRVVTAESQGSVVKPASIAALPVLLSVTAGYVDTAGYVALQGLFTAHVTGNFVTLGASPVSGTSLMLRAGDTR